MPVPELSQTEERIVLLVAQGRSRREIAAVVGLDVRTVDWLLAQANRKLEKAAHSSIESEEKSNERKGAEKCAFERQADASRD
jgi:DNA-binding NarL/FixJ family response regulator